MVGSQNNGTAAVRRSLRVVVVVVDAYLRPRGKAPTMDGTW
jgi:hypothetical protein